VILAVAEHFRDDAQRPDHAACHRSAESGSGSAIWITTMPPKRVTDGGHGEGTPDRPSSDFSGRRGRVTEAKIERAEPVVCSIRSAFVRFQTRRCSGRCPSAGLHVYFTGDIQAMWTRCCMPASARRRSFYPECPRFPCLKGANHTKNFCPPCAHPQSDRKDRLPTADLLSDVDRSF